MQGFAKEVGVSSENVANANNASSLPAASEAYVKKIKARLEAVKGECISLLIWMRASSAIPVSADMISTSLGRSFCESGPVLFCWEA